MTAEPTPEELAAEGAIYDLPTLELGAILEADATFVRRLLVVGEYELVAVALWTAHTYVVECSRATAYLHFCSPEPGSGKTTALEVLELTVYNPVQADGLSEAVLFRMLDQKHPTLLLDEVDAIFGKRNSDSTEGIRQVLNSGYRKGRRVWRCVGPAHEVKPFDVFGAKALAGLNELPGTLAHRAIPIALKPPLPSDVYEELDAEDLEEETDALRYQFQAWADASRGVLCDPALRPRRLEGLDARGNEIWRPLLRIADLAGGDWPERARQAALELSGRSRQQHDSKNVQLLGHIRDVFVEERMFCAAICKALNEDDELPYGGWNDGKGITSRELGQKLRRYEIKAKSIRIDGEGKGNGYEREAFEDAWSRYLDTTTGTTGTSLYPSQKPAETEPGQDPAVPVVENGANPHGSTVVPLVPVVKCGSGAEEANGRIPGPGDPDFLEALAEAHRNGHLTEAEAKKRWSLHKLIEEDADAR